MLLAYAHKTKVYTVTLPITQPKIQYPQGYLGLAVKGKRVDFNITMVQGLVETNCNNGDVVSPIVKLPQDYHKWLHPWPYCNTNDPNDSHHQLGFLQKLLQYYQWPLCII